MKYGNRLFLCMLCIVFILSGCHNSKRVNEEKGNTKVSISNSSNGSKGDSKNDAVNIEAIKETVKKMVGNHIYYYNTYSFLYPISQKTSDVDIYTAKTSNSIYILFEEKLYAPALKDSGSAFCALCLKIGSRGYDYRINNFIAESSTEELRHDLLIQGYTLFKKVQIAFGDSSKPVFNKNLISNKQKVVSDIKNIAEKQIRDLKISGSYEYYIVDFDYNNYETYVVISNNSDNWILNLNLEEDWKATPSNIIKVNQPDLKYLMQQYKKTTVYIGNFKY